MMAEEDGGVPIHLKLTLRGSNFATFSFKHPFLNENQLLKERILLC